MAGRQQRLQVRRALSSSPNNAVWVDPNPNPNPDGLLARVEALSTRAELARFWQQYKALHCSGHRQAWPSSSHRHSQGRPEGISGTA